MKTIKGYFCYPMKNTTKPVLLVNKERVERNIQMMSRKAEASNAIFRPHFKTHQSVEVGELFRKYGVQKITVSSVSMAKFFTESGWNDITIAFPVNLHELDEIDELAGKISLNLLVDSAYSAARLGESLQSPAGLFIEIDNGYGRSGLKPGQIPEIKKILKLTDQNNLLKFKGFLTHAGNTYAAKGRAEILKIMDDTANELHTLKMQFAHHYPDLINSYGDTPSCSLADNLNLFDEIRPGNFVYYDVMQYHIGSCRLEDIAVAVACPVVSVYPERNELIIYGGAVHLSKENIEGNDGFRLYGYVVNLSEKGWSEPIIGAYVSSLSQEHGIIKMPESYISKFRPGDVIGILPIHSCLTANLLKEHTLLQ